MKFELASHWTCSILNYVLPKIVVGVNICITLKCFPVSGIKRERGERESERERERYNICLHIMAYFALLRQTKMEN